MRGDSVWFAIALLGLALVLGTQAPAAATEQPALSLSGDGERWTARLDRTLVGPDQRWVPGARTTVTVWVRNLSTSEARLDVRLLGDDNRWGDDDLQLSAEVGGRRVVVEPGLARRVAPLTGPTPIDLTIAMSKRATNRVQQLGSAFSVQLTLVDAAAAPRSDGPTLAGLSEPVAGHLPDGTPPFGVPLTAIAIAVAARAARVALRRHHAQEVPS